MEVDETSNLSIEWVIGFVCFALLSTYLPTAYPYLSVPLILIFGLMLARLIQKIQASLWLRRLYYLSIIISVAITQKEPLFIIIAALILYSIFKFKDTFSLSCILVAPIIFITEILAYWGLPFTIWLIWYWGLPFIFLSSIIVFLFKEYNKLPIVLTLSVGILLIFNTLILYKNKDSTIKLVQAEASSNMEGVSDNLIKNL